MKASEQNDVKTIIKLLRAIGNAERAKQEKQDIIFNVAADLLEEAYVK